ncbi:hypothetical protein [Neisseria chenwenguii]|uniref:hypothetical protein n=1 Tax=Neisseria chenwenguii TaxID=1853278 RepID=UPI000F4E5C3A|nr:hypothetical protein [Neisseria chenwenguii]ROV57154.1 hypothetical protein EGS38_00195 [Neisseria chenwenguii]
MTQQIQWQKPVCQLDSDGIYLHQTMADLDVYTKDGGYIIPGGCIDAEPPETREGQAAKWNGSGWDYLPDLRGQTAYRTDSGEAVLIDRIGALSDGLTLEPRPGEAHEWRNGAWAENAERAAGIKVQALATAKAAKLDEINSAAQAFVKQSAELDKVPEFEVATWPLQAAEAQAWYANPEAETPVLAAIAGARGLDLDKLRAAALRKANAYTALSAHIAGQRQALVDKLDKAKTLKAVEAVSVSYALPG